MEEMIAKLPTWAKLLPTIFTALVLIATVVVRFTDSESDDKVVGKAKGYLLAALHRFPTLGKNPMTKKLEKALGIVDGKPLDDKTPSSDT